MGSNQGGYLSKFLAFDNATGEGVVSFGPASGGFFTGLFLSGEPLFKFGSPCGTCGTVFRKVACASHRIDDREAAALLGPLDTVPAEVTLARLARPLPRGKYRVAVLESRVALVQPGGPDDFFATDVVRLHGRESVDPGTAYYRLARSGALWRSGASGAYQALVAAIAMPIHEPANLDRSRIEAWKEDAKAGRTLTALAVAVLDVQGPAVYRDPNYPYWEHRLLTCCILDGHHRLQAAAELDVPIRVLAFLTLDCSSPELEDDDVDAVLDALNAP